MPAPLPAPPTFAVVFDHLRCQRGLTPAQLARELDEREGNVSRWRRGVRPTLEKVHKIADYFGVERTRLEQLAGYTVRLPQAADLDVDPELLASLEAERAELRVLLRGVDPVHWPTILRARSRAGQLAVQLARELVGKGPLPDPPLEPAA